MINNRIDANVLVAVIIGVIAIGAILALTFLIHGMTEFQQNVVWAILALGIAGGAAVLPGFLSVEVPKIARAGGSLAVLLLVYTQSPAGKVVIEQVIPPDGNSEVVAKACLESIDKEEYQKVYQLSASWVHANYGETELVQLLEQQRKPLGKPSQRVKKGINAASNPPGLPPGAYKAYTYLTKFVGSGAQQWVEIIIVGDDQRKWKSYSYTVNQVNL
jgi:hypothetical protein